MIALHRPRLARINNFLLACIVVVNGYVIMAPLLPNIGYWWGEHFYHTSQKLQATLKTPVATQKTGPSIPAENRLIVPSMQLDATIYDGQSAATLSKGLWRRPLSSTPDKGGNTVIAGHRFTYTNPKGIFYYLNKVQIGEQIGVYWQGTKYVYKVTGIRIVPPTEISVESPTADARLTLYTCTPLWAPHQRLIIIAKLEPQA